MCLSLEEQMRQDMEEAKAAIKSGNAPQVSDAEMCRTCAVRC